VSEVVALGASIEFWDESVGRDRHGDLVVGVEYSTKFDKVSVLEIAGECELDLPVENPSLISNEVKLFNSNFVAVENLTYVVSLV
jgi:hypothetical protein